jgi:hypothetical protein
MQRRAVLDLILSLLMSLAFAIGWLIAHLPGWDVALGVLLLIQALAYTAFVYRVKSDLQAWRRNWLRATIACAVWAIAVGFVTAQLSIIFMIGWSAFAVLWIGWMVLMYVRLRKRRLGAQGPVRAMPSAFRRIADELNPKYVPEWAIRQRRPVPRYSSALLRVFGQYWLPRLGLGLQLAGSLELVSTMVAFVGRQWVLSIVLGAISILTIVVGSVMWNSYRIRHWLPAGSGSAAPMATPVPRSFWVWLLLAMIDSLTGTAASLWLMTSNGSIRNILLGAAILSLCAGTASAILITQVDRISPGGLTLFGWSAKRSSVVILLAAAVFAATMLLQLPFSR